MRGELLARLGSRYALERALEEGTWQRVWRGTYVAGDGPLDLQVRAAAARRVLPVRSLVADRSLLWLRGVDVLPPGPPELEVVVPRGAVVPRRAGLRARETSIPRRDRQIVGGVPVLRAERAVADLLRRLPLVEAVVVADAALHAGLVTLPALRDELVLHARLRGVRLAHSALDLSDARAESPPESRLRVLFRGAGLVLTPQLEVRASDGRWLARVDLGSEQARLAVEYDGRAVHERSATFLQDRRRQNVLQAAGWTVLRYTADDLRERPAAVVAEVRAALRRRAA